MVSISWDGSTVKILGQIFKIMSIRFQRAFGFHRGKILIILLCTAGHVQKSQRTQEVHVVTPPSNEVTPPSNDRVVAVNLLIETFDSTGVRYSWKPNHGSFVKWEPELMCRILGGADTVVPFQLVYLWCLVNCEGRHIMIVGDSLSEETYHTWLSAMWANILIPSRGGDVSDTKIDSAVAWRDKADKIANKCTNFCFDSDWSCAGPTEVNSFPLLVEFFALVQLACSLC